MNDALQRALNALTEADYKHLKSCDKEVRIRRAVEIAVIRKLASDLLWKPYQLEVHDGEVYHSCTTPDEVVDAVFSVDSAVITLLNPNQTIHASINIVLGNDGWDCINDYSTKLESRMLPANKFAEELAEWL